jgi:hypothetical protein
MHLVTITVGQGAEEEEQMYPPRIVRQALIPALLGILVVLTVSACEGEGQEQAKARSLPEERQALRPGEYSSGEFRPSFSFRIGRGWTADLEMSDALAITRGEDIVGERQLLGFAKVEEVYRPSRTGTTTPEKAPKDIVGWFQHHPYLQLDEPEPVTVGGLKGVQFDVLIEHLPDDHYGVCGSDCVDLFRLSSDHRHVIFEEEVQRVIVLEDVKGETVTVVIASGATDFDKVVPKAQKVLGTVDWKGA